MMIVGWPLTILLVGFFCREEDGVHFCMCDGGSVCFISFRRYMPINISRVFRWSPIWMLIWIFITSFNHHFHLQAVWKKKLSQVDYQPCNILALCTFEDRLRGQVVSSFAQFFLRDFRVSKTQSKGFWLILILLSSSVKTFSQHWRELQVALKKKNCS